MRFLRPLAALILGAAAFSLIQQFLHLQLWISAVIAIAVAAFTVVGEFFDFVKKPFEVRKLWLEGSKLQRQAAKEREADEQSRRLVRLPTPDEVKDMAPPTWNAISGAATGAKNSIVSA